MRSEPANPPTRSPNGADALRAATAKAEAALGATNDPRADRIRQALGAVREAAGGDDAKAAAALATLDAALKGQ